MQNISAPNSQNQNQIENVEHVIEDDDDTVLGVDDEDNNVSSTSPVVTYTAINTTAKMNGDIVEQQQEQQQVLVCCLSDVEQKKMVSRGTEVSGGGIVDKVQQQGSHDSSYSTESIAEAASTSVRRGACGMMLGTMVALTGKRNQVRDDEEKTLTEPPELKQQFIGKDETREQEAHDRCGSVPCGHSNEDDDLSKWERQQQQQQYSLSHRPLNDEEVIKQRPQQMMTGRKSGRRIPNTAPPGSKNVTQIPSSQVKNTTSSSSVSREVFNADVVAAGVESPPSESSTPIRVCFTGIL